MRPTEFDIKIIKVIMSIRTLKNVKQVNLAKALNISDSYFCKIEHCQKALTMGQIKTLAEYLNTSYVQILLLAEVDDIIELNLNTRSKNVLMHTNYAEETGFSMQELVSLVTKIKETYKKP